MKVLIPDKLHKKATDILKKAGFKVANIPGMSTNECAKIVADYDAMIVRSGLKITPLVINPARKLKVIVRAGVGVDSIDITYAAQKKIAVLNTPFGNTNAAAEHTLTLLLMLAKHIMHAHIELKKGIWDRKKYKGIELKGKTLGIIGLGNIGKKIAKVAHALEMDVVGCDPYIDFEMAKKIDVKKVDFDILIRNSDFITVHVPKTNRTINMIAKKQFQLMKNGVRILNVARGGIINEDDLVEALESGKVSAAAIDVWNEETPIGNKLLKMKQVITTPHLGALTHEAQINVAVDAANQVIAALKDGKIINCVNGIEKIKNP